MRCRTRVCTVFGVQEFLGFLVFLWLFWDPKGRARLHGARNAETEFYRTCSMLFCCVRNRDDSALHFISRSLGTLAVVVRCGSLATCTCMA